MSCAPAQKTELELVHEATDGVLNAFEELMARYQRAVFNIALYKSKNYFDAEDLTQEVFLAAFKALSTLKAPENFGAWLFGIAYNRCHKWFQRERNKILKIQEIQSRAAREERTRLRNAAAPFAPPASPYGSHGNAASPAEQVLSEALQRLPREVREALTLKYLEGLSYQEIEKQLGINAHRIDYLIRKGKQMLRERVGRSDEGGIP